MRNLSDRNFAKQKNFFFFSPPPRMEFVSRINENLLHPCARYISLNAETFYSVRVRLAAHAKIFGMAGAYAVVRIFMLCDPCCMRISVVFPWHLIPNRTAVTSLSQRCVALYYTFRVAYRARHNDYTRGQYRGYMNFIRGTPTL